MAQRLTCAQVEAGLPQTGVAAFIRLSDVSVGAVKMAAENASIMRMRDDQVEGEIPAGRIHVERGEEQKLIRMLAVRGLVEPIEEQHIWRVRGVPVTDGHFGVEKRGETVGPRDSRIRQRLIINMVPSNMIQHAIPGDLGALPTTAQWNSFQLEQLEVLLLSSSDRRCFFYLFRMEPCWRGAMTLAGRYPMGWFDGGGVAHGRLAHVAITAVPMGWISAVNVCQHVHRQLLRLGRDVPWTPECGGDDAVDWSNEVRRDRPLPVQADGLLTEGFMVYVDNLDEYEVFLADEPADLVGTVSPLQRRSKEIYSFRGAVGNDAELTSRQWKPESLGYVTDGWPGRRNTPAGYISKLIDLAFWALTQSSVTRRTMQVIAGRWIRVSQARRAVASCFDRVWRMIGRGPWLISMDAEICAELISAVALALLCFANLRTPIDSVVTASDASESGAGVVISVCLSPVGLQMVASFEREGIALASEHLGLVSLFDGIGGARRALEILGAAPACTYCSEIDPACVRVVDSAWPGIRHLGDVRKVSRRTWWKMMQENPRVWLWLISGGFPCQDLSQLNALREGLDGARSSLLWEMLRI